MKLTTAKQSILVMGSRGAVGRRVVCQLHALGHGPKRATRHPCDKDDVHLDLTMPNTFASALSGIETVMLISRPGDEQAHVVAEPLVQAMVKAGVARVVVLSALHAERRPSFSIRKVELLVEQSGLRFVHVRPNFFMQMLASPPLSTEIAEFGTLSLPTANAAIAYVDANDVAAVLVKALLNPALDGRGIEVNGPVSLTHSQVASSIGQMRGQLVQYIAIDDERARALLLQRGFQPPQIERLMAFYQLIRSGHCSQADDGTVQALLGRPLRTFQEAMTTQIAMWRPA